MKASWTQPICDDCWDRMNPERQSHRLAIGAVEQCSFCGGKTNSGIYVRADPASVLFPAYEEEP